MPRIYIANTLTRRKLRRYGYKVTRTGTLVLPYKTNGKKKRRA